MDLVLNKLEKQNFFDFIRTFSIPIGIMILVAMMVIPLSPWLLDILFTSNLLVALLVLMVALQAFKPLDFSSFPTVLLFATVLRLGLNVASTRVILQNGHNGTDSAGRIIEAFGEFVMSGRANLHTSAIDANLIATLPLKANLPWFAALAGGLPLAAGTYIATKLFDSEIDRFSSAVYIVEGSLADPQLRLDKVFDNETPAQ